MFACAPNADVCAISQLFTTLGKLATKKEKARCSKAQQLWWVALACCWAGVQVHTSGQGAGSVIHERIRVKFNEAVNLILKWENLPAYVTLEMFNSTDIEFKKPRLASPEANEQLWNKWLEIKKVITNRENPAIYRVQRMMRSTGDAVGSGKGMEAWVEALTGALYRAQLTEPAVVDPGLGGSAAKAASAESADDANSCAALFEAGVEAGAAGKEADAAVTTAGAASEEGAVEGAEGEIVMWAPELEAAPKKARIDKEGGGQRRARRGRGQRRRRQRGARMSRRRPTSFPTTSS